MSYNFTTVTELPGHKASEEQFKRLYQRYHFASQFCKEKDVLEVACGSGFGLGYLASAAKRVVAGDVDEGILKYAIDHYRDRGKIEIKVLDAQNLPFEENCFDVIILYEAIYYLSQPERFIQDARRLLREKGVLIISTANRDWTGFNPSPYSTKYLSAQELQSLLSQEFSKVEILGGFPANENSLRSKTTSIIKRTARVLHLIPKTMKGKEKIKRIFFGKLKTLPREIKEGDVEYLPPVQILSLPSDIQYKVIFAVASV